MKKLANTLMIIGLGFISLFILYSLQIDNFTSSESAIILFFTGILIVTGVLIKTFVNKNIISKEKLFSRLMFSLVSFVIITYNLIKNFI